MSAGHQSRAGRLSFLAVLAWLWAVCAVQAHVKTASIAQTRLSETPLLSLRLERGNPCWQGLSFEGEGRLSLAMPIGIFCGGDPINSFDPDGRCLEAGWNATKYGGGIALGTLAGMANDVDAMNAIGNPSHPRYGEVTLNMGMQMAMDYENGGEGLGGTRNAFNRYNPMRSPFEAVSGMSMMEGPQLGQSLTWDQSAVAWANTISLAASIGAGAPGTMKAVSSDLGTFTSTFRAAETTAPLPEGSFSIADWNGYPANLPQPNGPFRLLEGAEYDAARAAANSANRAMHQADPALDGLQLHEIQPVKFGGSPTAPANKLPLTPQQHAPATTWWNQLQRQIE